MGRGGRFYDPSEGRVRIDGQVCVCVRECARVRVLVFYLCVYLSCLHLCAVFNPIFVSFLESISESLSEPHPSPFGPSSESCVSRFASARALCPSHAHAHFGMRVCDSDFVRSTHTHTYTRMSVSESHTHKLVPGSESHTHTHTSLCVRVATEGCGGAWGAGACGKASESEGCRGGDTTVFKSASCLHLIRVVSRHI